MGSVWLGSLPTVLRNAGLDVDTYRGWETRSRSSGGYDTILGIQCHHTASSGRYPASEMRYMWETGPYPPIGAIYLAPDGKVTVGAAGATNTSGRGGPMVTSRGTVPLNAGNRFLISIEAANPGDGTPWPAAQQDAYVQMCAALSKAYLGGILAQPGDCGAHFEWTDRKIDPAGSSRYASGGNKWNMTKFRSDVVAAMNSNPLPPAGDDMQPINPFRNSDTRVFGGPGIEAGAHRFGLHPDVIPANAKAVFLNLTVVASGSPGFIRAWPDGLPMPDTSCGNYEATGAHAGSIMVGVKDRHFNVWISQRAHVIVDVTGYWV